MANANVGSLAEDTTGRPVTACASGLLGARFAIDMTKGDPLLGQLLQEHEGCYTHPPKSV